MANLRDAAVDRNLSDARYAGWKVVEASWECLALVNQVFFEKGLAKSLGSSTAFNDRPDRIDELITTITTSSSSADILDAGEDLARGTRAVLRRAQASAPATTTIREQFQRGYPEFKDAGRKLRAACNRGDRVGANADAWPLQSDVTSMLDKTVVGLGDGNFNRHSEIDSAYRRHGLPDLMAYTSGPLATLAEQADLFDQRLGDLLGEHSAGWDDYRDIDEFRASM